MKKVQSQSTSNPASISQAAAVAALDDSQEDTIRITLDKSWRAFGIASGETDVPVGVGRDQKLIDHPIVGRDHDIARLLEIGDLAGASLTSGGFSPSRRISPLKARGLPDHSILNHRPRAPTPLSHTTPQRVGLPAVPAGPGFAIP